MNAPEFKYPDADARFVWVPCEKDDPQREEFWCQTVEMWCALKNTTFHEPKSHIDEYQRAQCGEHWRKRVAVPPLPEGFEIAPPDVPFDSSMRWFSELSGYASYQPNSHIGVPVGQLARDGKRGNSTILFFIRRKPAQPVAGQWVSKETRHAILPCLIYYSKACTKPDCRGPVACFTPRDLDANDTWTHWMPLPEPPAPPKSDAELAWENYRPQPLQSIKVSFLAGYAAAKEGTCS